MRVSFDLDEVLFVDPATHKTEKPPVFPFDRLFRERLRLGTPEAVNRLQALGYEVWVYTSSFRSERYIRRLFRLYGVCFDGIVNGMRHLKEVQKDNKTVLPQKMPSRYRISLHIDDETVICSLGPQYGFKSYRLDAQDDDWVEKIIERAEKIKRIERPEPTDKAGEGEKP
ncbi:MAG: HAD family hydrolase [Clostridia bacterium]|nr:HAD family hydrolase [Clostridia bacterium]MBR5257808.1 HAD family hydrolase [Clostridia bacterium]